MISPTPNITWSVLSLQVTLTALGFPVDPNGTPPHLLLPGDSHCGRGFTHPPATREEDHRRGTRFSFRFLTATATPFHLSVGERWGKLVWLRALPWI